MICGWCDKELVGWFKVREIRDCYDGRFFLGLHEQCIKPFEKANRSWKVESTLSEMIGYLLVSFCSYDTVLGEFPDDRYLWVI